MRPPTVARDVVPITQSIDGWDDLDDASRTRTLLDGLWEKGAKFTPRWRAVLMTSMAELDAREANEAGTPTVPLVDMNQRALATPTVSRNPPRGIPLLSSLAGSE